MKKRRQPVGQLLECKSRALVCVAAADKHRAFWKRRKNRFVPMITHKTSCFKRSKHSLKAQQWQHLRVYQKFAETHAHKPTKWLPPTIKLWCWKYTQVFVIRQQQQQQWKCERWFSINSKRLMRLASLLISLSNELSRNSIVFSSWPLEMQHVVGMCAQCAWSAGCCCRPTNHERLINTKLAFSESTF